MVHAMMNHIDAVSMHTTPGRHFFFIDGNLQSDIKSFIIFFFHPEIKKK